METLNQGMELCCYICVLYFLTGIKLTKNIWHYAAAFLVIAVIEIVLEKSGNTHIAPIWMFVQIFCLCFLISGGKRKRVLVSIGTYSIFGFFNTFVAMGMNMLHIDNSVAYMDYSWYVCLALLLFFGIWIKVKKKNLGHPKISTSVYILMILMAALTTGLVMCDIIYWQNVGKRGTVLTTLIVILTIIVIGIILTVLLLSEDSLKHYKERTALMEKYLEMQERYYASVCDGYQKIRMFEHDMKKHFELLGFMMEEEKYKEAREYVGQLAGQICFVTNRIYSCSNYIISAILNQMALLIEAEKIQLQFEYKVFDQITVKAADLSTIVYNLMQNAVEACQKTEGEKRTIFLGFYGCESTLIIKIRNSVAKKVDEQKIRSFQTSKENSEKHGFGLRNVDAAIKKYNGLMEFQCKEEVFGIEIFLFNVIGNTELDNAE